MDIASSANFRISVPPPPPGSLAVDSPKDDAATLALIGAAQLGSQTIDLLSYGFVDGNGVKPVSQNPIGQFISNPVGTLTSAVTGLVTGTQTTVANVAQGVVTLMNPNATRNQAETAVADVTQPLAQAAAAGITYGVSSVAGPISSAITKPAIPPPSFHPKRPHSSHNHQPHCHPVPWDITPLLRTPFKC